MVARPGQRAALAMDAGGSIAGRRGPMQAQPEATPDEGDAGGKDEGGEKLLDEHTGYDLFLRVSSTRRLIWLGIRIC